MKPVPPDQLDFATFNKLMTTRFRVKIAPTATVELELVGAESAGETTSNIPNARRCENFSLHFTGPATQPLSQRTYCFAHDELGEFDLFIVPIAAEAEMIRYQAVFNRLLPLK